VKVLYPPGKGKDHAPRQRVERTMARGVQSA